MRTNMNIVRIVIHHLGNLLRSLRLVYLRAAGVMIGKRTMISLGARLDVRRGEIVIGNDCLITYGSRILSHDGASRMIDPKDSGEGRVIIGDNVFVGVNAVIMRNVTVGSNSVIGAGAIVTKDVPPGVLVAGNPAKVIKELPKPYPCLSSKRHLKRFLR